MTRSLGRVGPALLLALLFAAPAGAHHVQCGDTITTDTTLDSDLVCAGDGLMLNGDVTLDFAGHAISGAGTGTGVTSFGGTIEVRGGTIDGFANGLFADGPDVVLVHEMVIRRNGAGAVCAFVPQCTVLYSTLEDNSVGIDMEFVGEFPARGGTVRRSIVRDNASAGLDLSVTRGTVTDNRIERNGTGVDMDEATVEVSRNTIAANFEDGVVVTFLSDATITDNRIAGNGGNGVAVFGDHFFENTDAVVRRNRIADNAVDGVLVVADGAHVLAEQNETHRNADDGIDVQLREGASDFTVDTILRANKAYFNGDLGIHAVAGTVDGGANKARHNGNPLQCVGVVCR